jgi:hypothetical protein
MLRIPPLGQVDFAALFLHDDIVRRNVWSMNSTLGKMVVYGGD